MSVHMTRVFVSDGFSAKFWSNTREIDLTKVFATFFFTLPMVEHSNLEGARDNWDLRLIKRIMIGTEIGKIILILYSGSCYACRRGG